MAKKKKLTRIHLLYNSKFLPFPWLVKIIGDQTTYGLHDHSGKLMPGVWAKWRTKYNALSDAKDQAKKREPSSLRIHGRDGQIQSERSYGKGSESPRKG